MSTRLADLVFEPEPFAARTLLLTRRLVSFWNSGVFAESVQFNQLMSSGGRTFTVPNFVQPNPGRDAASDAAGAGRVGDVSDAERNVNDIETDVGRLRDIQSTRQIGVRQSLAEGWSSMDLTAELAAADPLSAIQSTIANYWAQVIQIRSTRILQAITGLTTAANNGVAGTFAAIDVVRDITVGAPNAVGAQLDLIQFLSAVNLMGENARNLRILAVHSAVFNHLHALNQVIQIPDSLTGEPQPYLGRYRLVESDDMPVTIETVGADAGVPVYHSWLFEPGALGFAFGTPEVPAEIDRIPTAGNLGGETQFISRVELLLHPLGFAWSGLQGGDVTTSVDLTNPNRADLATANNWKTVFPERGQIPMIGIRHTTQF